MMGLRSVWMDLSPVSLDMYISIYIFIYTTVVLPLIAL